MLQFLGILRSSLAASADDSVVHLAKGQVALVSAAEREDAVCCSFQSRKVWWWAGEEEEEEEE